MRHPGPGDGDRTLSGPRGPLKLYGRTVMYDMPIYLKQHLGSRVLGRLKLKLYERILDQADKVPEGAEIRPYILDQCRVNIRFGTVQSLILKINSSEFISWDDFRDPDSISLLLDDLRLHPLDEPIFVELSCCPNPLPEFLGVLIYREELAYGGYVYVITLVDADTFPNSISGRLEICATINYPQPLFSVLESGEWKGYGLDNWEQSWQVGVAVSVLNYLNDIQKHAFVGLEEIDHTDFDNSHYVPPKDPRFSALVQLALHGKLTCSELEVPLGDIHPYNWDFCMSYPQDIVVKAATNLKNGLPVRLLVYWNGTRFIMSDDYAHYLAYRSLLSVTVPIVVIGPVPAHVGKPTRVGGSELIPPAWIPHMSDTNSLDPELKNWLLDKHLATSVRPPSLTKLYGLFLELSYLIQDPDTKEHQLHDLLLKYPIVLDPHNCGIMSEVRLDDKYRIDLIIHSNLDDRRVLLVELEKASWHIFTAAGRPRSHVTHALQQVEDWLRWWRENPTRIPNPIDSSIPPHGLVVIGRNANLSDEDRRRLLHLNYNRTVKVVTYDDLLIRILDLIRNLEGINS
jgi:hypothetical protein